MGGKSYEYTLGYRYYLSVHMILCHGPASVEAIKVGDKDAVWRRTDPINTPSKCYLDGYNMFGGEDGEGGVAGEFYVFGDGMIKSISDYLEGQVEGPVPGYLGVSSVFIKNAMMCMMNPYPKPWRFQVKRIPGSLGTNVAPGIGTDFVNPGLIILECLLDQSFGLGAAGEDIDYASFNSACQTLLSEGFGLAVRWDKTNTIEDFIGEICQIIDAQLSMDPVSGKFALKLIRQDYNYDSLMSLGPSDIIELTDFVRPDPKDLVNQVTVVFEDYKTGVQQSITETNAAALLLNPSVNAVQLTYPGIPTQVLARKVALRELAQYSSGLARCTIVANRKAAGLKMGDCFKLDWPPLNFEGLTMRVTNFQQGESSDWRVRLECVQDMYGMPETIFDASESETGWKAPDYTPLPISRALIYELPYYLVAWHVTGDKNSAWSDLPEGFGYAAAAAAPPSGVSMAFEVLLQEPSYNNEWKPNRRLAFCDYAFLSSDIDDIVTQINITGGNIYEIDLNSPALLDGEWVLVTAYNSNAGAVTVARGCMDTVPRAHAAGSVIWFVEMYNNTITREYLTGQTMTARFSTVTPTGSISAAASPAFTYRFNNRAARPIAPANLRVNDIYRPKTLAAWADNLKWHTRNRKDTARVINDTAGAYAHEEGTEYSVKIREKLFSSSAWFDASTTTGLTASPLSLAGKYTPQAYSLEITAWAVMNGLESWERSVITLVHDPFVPSVISMSTANPPTAGRASGDLFILPADASSNPNCYLTWRNGAFVSTQPEEGDKVSLSGTIYEYSNGWSEV